MTINYSSVPPEQSGTVVALFTEVFAASEGEAEGRIIGDLVSRLIEQTPAQDLIGCYAYDEDRLIGSVLFSRFGLPQDKTAFLLSPAAVSTTHQRSGIGQQLISYGLNCLKAMDVAFAFTYGDPAFYAKVGFEPISEDIVAAPFKLSYPFGWVGQSLGEHALEPMPGATNCVAALSDPKYW